MTFYKNKRTLEGSLSLNPKDSLAASMADIFDEEVKPEWRSDFWDLVRQTPWLGRLQRTS
jgi:protein gp37